MLPKISYPLYELKLPSNGQAIKVRPFLVKEEKLLLMAIESNDENEIINTTKQVINNCIVEGKVNVDTLPFFDIDYLFIALRAKSVGESIEVKFTCNNIVESRKCGNIFPANIDIANCGVVTDPTVTNTINLGNNMSVKMKYPSYAVMKKLLDKDNVLNKKINIIVESIEYIQDKEKLYTSKDLTKEEIAQFIEGLTQNQFKAIEKFVDNFPSFVVLAEANCPKCGFQHKLQYKEFTSFFG